MEIVYMCILWITEGRNTSCNPLCPQTQFFNENRLKHRVGICWLLPEVNTPALQLWKAAVKMPLAYIHVCVVWARSQGHVYLELHVLNLLSISFPAWPCLMSDITAYRKLQSASWKSTLSCHLQKDWDGPSRKFTLMSRKITAILFNTCNDFCQRPKRKAGS